MTAQQPAPAPTARPWWEPGVIYQVYPRSFQDTNGDGVGDLAGVTARLDHLEWLGVDAIWLSPIYRSPMTDFGYDVADYTDVDPIFGTLDDLGRLVAEAHRRGIRVLLDFVPNHTSSEHPWFRASRSSRDDPRRGWYLWADPAPGGGPPNNWRSMFGGSAWQWDGATGQYYYHAFLPAQPDLDWRNPEVREAMMDVLRFWFDRGIDGFRIDVLWHVMKDPALRDNPPNPSHTGDSDAYHALLPVNTTDLPEAIEIAALIRRTADAYGARLLIGEIYLPVERLVRWYGTADAAGVHLPFNFQLLLMRWDATRIGSAIAAYEAALPDGAWPNWVLGNHDQPRLASRVGRAQARVAAMLLLTLRGTPTIYQGDEIGMVNVEIPPERQRDPARRAGREQGRDPERTPMQWDGTSPGHGFTSGEPWLPIAPDADEVNVAAQVADPRSLLSLHRRLVALRRGEPALSVGDWRPLIAEGGVLGYLRLVGDRRLAVVLNLRGEPATAGLPAAGRVLLSTGLDREDEPVGRTVELRPDEGLIVALEGGLA